MGIKNKFLDFLLDGHALFFLRPLYCFFTKVGFTFEFLGSNIGKLSK
jgi:hypothetical protein